MKFSKPELDKALRCYIRKGKLNGGYLVKIIYSQMYDHYYFCISNKRKKYVYNSDFGKKYFSTEDDCINECGKFIKNFINDISNKID